MIDERQEELATLYALDLLEGEERSQFEAALVRDVALQNLVRELRESSSALAHTAVAAEPPTELKRRILSSIADRQPAIVPDNVIRPAAFGFRQFVPWAVAACFAVGAAWLGQLFVSSRTEAEMLRTQHDLADVALKQVRNQLEAERLLASRQIVDLNQQISDSGRRLADLQRSADENDQRRIAVQNQEGEARRQLADAQTRLASVERQLGDARTEADVANFKIATLASMLENSPQALAVAVWNPARQEGVLTLEKMPALAAGQTLELWVIEDKKAPVSAGVISAGATRVSFKPVSPIAAAAKFAVSREKDDGIKAHASPGQVVMISQ